MLPEALETKSPADENVIDIDLLVLLDGVLSAEEPPTAWGICGSCSGCSGIPVGRVSPTGDDDETIAGLTRCARC